MLSELIDSFSNYYSCTSWINFIPGINRSLSLRVDRCGHALERLLISLDEEFPSEESVKVFAECVTVLHCIVAPGNYSSFKAVGIWHYAKN